jgi:hypothetical protein
MSLPPPISPQKQPRPGKNHPGLEQSNKIMERIETPKIKIPNVKIPNSRIRVKRPH